ncbi:LysR substrate-binding domain-containing protein [Chloroflexota bacterium]
MINIDSLNFFLDVAETKNFSKTAQRFHITQPTVSKRIHELEQDLDVLLFVRQSNGVQITDAGKTMIPWARKLVSDSINLKNMMGSLDQKISGHLKIACSTTAGKYILPQLAGRFREKHPDVRISILPCTQENISLQLLSEEADLGVASKTLGQSGLECQYFFTDHIILLVPESHHWATRKSIEPDELLNEPCIMREKTSGTRQTLQSELAKFDIAINDLQILLEVGNAEAIVLAISSGMGVSFVSKMASAYARAWGCVVEVPVQGFNLQRKLCIGRKIIGPPNRVMGTFWNFIHIPENADLFQLPDK